MRTTYRIFLHILALAVVVLCVFCGSCGKSTFDGSRVADEDGLYLSFTMLDGTEEVAITARAGESLSVRIALEAGTVDLVITAPDGTSAYTGTALTDGAFSVGLAADGTYTITVTGSRAAGTVEIVRE